MSQPDRSAPQPPGTPINPGWRARRPSRVTYRSPVLPSLSDLRAWVVQQGGWRYLAGVVVGMLLVVFVAMQMNRSASPSTSATSVPLENAPRPSAAIVLPQVPTTTLGIQRFVVQGTEGLGLLMRQAPSRSAPVVQTLTDGTVVEQIDAERTAEEVTWKHIRTQDGIEGWVAASFLQPQR